ncbi:CcdB family protein [Meridianimarinicoccus sp. RP-17]|uniref:CcdB family protein n=1 Tax=Meridianimarinicoccus zhengii TaxID=2056810 RepID=UPI001C9B99A5|nr:CcdB family protein [Phycocomes zhengii]
MKQGNIHRLRDGAELVCRIQTDLGIETPFILCAPVFPRSEWGALTPKLHVAFQLDGHPYVVIMSQMVALPGAQIGPVVGDASEARDELVAAVDLLVSGF